MEDSQFSPKELPVIHQEQQQKLLETRQGGLLHKPPAAAQQGLHVMSKPIGPICNLDCEYCYYLHKEELYPSGEGWRMSAETLETYIRQYIAA